MATLQDRLTAVHAQLQAERITARYRQHRTFLTTDGQVDMALVRQLAANSANADIKSCKERGTEPPLYGYAYRQAYNRILSMAEVEFECSVGRAEFQKLPLEQQLLRSLRFERAKAAEGLAQPLDPQKIKDLDTAIAEAEARIAASFVMQAAE